MSYKFFDAAGIRMNGENRGMHMFRHYVATSLINEGHDTPIVMSVLGHTVPLAVDYYLESDYMQLKECGIDISRWPIRKEVLL
jgi:integrase